jgi:hypothetical protein
MPGTKPIAGRSPKHFASYSKRRLWPVAPALAQACAQSPGSVEEINPAQSRKPRVTVEAAVETYLADAIYRIVQERMPFPSSMVMYRLIGTLANRSIFPEG